MFTFKSYESLNQYWKRTVKMKMLPALIVLFHLFHLTLQQSGNAILKENFLFEKVGEGILNPFLVHFPRVYNQCDMRQIRNHSTILINTYRKICETRPPKIRIEKQIDEEDEQFILFKGVHNHRRARHMCTLVNSNLVEVRNYNDSKQLQSFMGLHHINSVHAGVSLYNDVEEALYLSDYGLATKIVFDKVTHTYYGKKEIVEATWTDIFERNKVSDKYGSTCYLTYRNFGINLTIHANFPTNTVNKDIAAKQALGNIQGHHVICRKSTIDSSYNTKWQKQCNTVLRTLEERKKKMDKKISQLKPSELPKPKKSIKPIIGLNIDNFDNTKYRSKRDNDDLLDINENVMSLIQYEDETEDDCTINMNSENKRDSLEESFHKRTKRWLFTLVNITVNVISAFGLFPSLDIFEHLGKMLINSKSEQRDTYVFTSLQLTSQAEKQMYELQLSMNATMRSQVLMSIEDQFNSMETYVKVAYQKIMKISNYDNYKIPLIEVFTPAEFSELSSIVYKTYGENLVPQMDKSSCIMYPGKRKIFLVISVPLQDKFIKNDIYRLHQLPIFQNNTKFESIQEVDYFAVNEVKQLYTILDYFEAKSCVEDSWCVSNAVSMPRTYPYCGISAYFDKKDPCQYLKKDKQMDPKFINVGNTTFFSIAEDKQSELEIVCPHFNARRQKMQISGIGFYQVPNLCYATIEGIVTRSATRVLDLNDSDDFTPKIKVMDKQISKQIKFNIIKIAEKFGKHNITPNYGIWAIVGTIPLILIIVGICAYIQWKQFTKKSSKFGEIVKGHVKTKLDQSDKNNDKFIEQIEMEELGENQGVKTIRLQRKT